MIVPVLSAVLATVVIVLGAFGLGRTIVGRGSEAGHDWSSATHAFISGSGFLGLALFLVGLIRFDALIVAAILIPLAGLGAWQLFRDRAAWRGVGFGGLRNAGWWLAVLITVVLALASLSPLVGDFGHDGIDYHVLGPQLWLREGRVVVAPEEARTAFPATIGRG